jgi:hypothetical protein
MTRLDFRAVLIRDEDGQILQRARELGVTIQGDELLRSQDGYGFQLVKTVPSFVGAATSDPVLGYSINVEELERAEGMASVTVSSAHACRLLY